MRPILEETADGSIQEHWLHKGPNGRLLRPLDVIDLEVQEPNSLTGFHSEDVILKADSVTYSYSLSPEQLEERLALTRASMPSALTTTQDRFIHRDAYSRNPLLPSLGLVKCTDVNIAVNPLKRGKYEITFKKDGAFQTLPLTDWRRSELQTEIDKTAMHWLCISAGLPLEGKCFRLVAGLWQAPN